MRVAHGHDYRGVSQELLHGYEVHAPIQEPGCEGMTKHSAYSRFLACQSQTRTQINKRFPGRVVVENELVLLAGDSLVEIASKAEVRWARVAV
jgi:hypothetical protein